MPRISLVPKDREFFTLFEAAGANVHSAGELLQKMLDQWPDGREIARDIVVCEQEGDRITHELIRRLNESFVTPLDREDVYALASALDDVVDHIEEAADSLGLYKIEAPMEQAQRQAEIIAAATAQIAQAMPKLRSFKDISAEVHEINRLENEGDRVVRGAIAALFDAGVDPMNVIRWKDVFEALEAAIDACEHVANALESVIIKNR